LKLRLTISVACLIIVVGKPPYCVREKGAKIMAQKADKGTLKLTATADAVSKTT